MKSTEEIYAVCQEANIANNRIGIIAWMHTFSPAKMWINGLKILRKPLLHLHTQYNRDIPWADIDMDFMNLNQSAHGDREFGFMASRMGIRRKVILLATGKMQMCMTALTYGHAPQLAGTTGGGQGLCVWRQHALRCCN